MSAKKAIEEAGLNFVTCNFCGNDTFYSTEKIQIIGSLQLTEKQPYYKYSAKLCANCHREVTELPIIEGKTITITITPKAL